MEKVQTAWESVKEAVSTAIEAIKGFFTGLVDSIKQEDYFVRISFLLKFQMENDKIGKERTGKEGSYE